ncbi:MAG: hypothetical protein HN352_18345, partial [Bacteroidetes bacterium]|nr:hypothetical protein [Bacteroidota bacterium]
DNWFQHTLKYPFAVERELQKIIDLVKEHSSFSVVEFCKIQSEANWGKSGEAVIVECLNHEVSPNPLVDIKFEEPLAIFCDENDDSYPRVLALRKSFPKTIHQHYSLENHPVELCLYEQPWSEVRITWTPQLFLDRILWWMKAASLKKLHHPDQPLEPMFFYNGTKLIVPNNLHIDDDETWVIVSCSQDQSPVLKMVRVKESELERYRRQSSGQERGYSLLYIKAEPESYGTVNIAPETLGALHTLLQPLGVDLWESVKGRIHDLFHTDNNLDPENELLLIFITFPGKRDDDSPPEVSGRHYAFFVCKGMGEIGLENDILFKNSKLQEGGRGLMPAGLITQSVRWQQERVLMVNIIPEITQKDLRRFNKIEYLPGEHPMLIGCGSLGSHLFNQWLRMGWSNWMIADNDNMLPHNVARHILDNAAVGYKKIEALQMVTKAILPEKNQNDVTSFPLDVTIDNEDIEKAFVKADIIVDVSTSLAVPRLLSQKEVARCASLFITPSGKDSVLLLEDSERNLRLHQIEAQYYNWIINHGAGETHLTGHTGSIRYGGGCRDISATIPISSVTLHAGTLCLNGNEKASCARVWQFNNIKGSVTAHDIQLYSSHEQKIEEWNLIWDDGILEKAHEYRNQNLPNETGGIIVGYIDQYSKQIFIVDIRKSPEDSVSTPRSFQRGVQGVADDVDMIKNRTAHIVSYIGEWHSHPDSIPAKPSSEDSRQLECTYEKMASCGQPGILVIVGQQEFTFCIKEYEVRL